MIARDQSIDHIPRANVGGAGHLQIVPMPPAADSATSPDGPSARDAAMPRHVVAVDDTPEIRDLLCDLLQSEGYRVSTFAAPPSIPELTGLAPDAIVLDLLYNGESVGLDFIAALRAEQTLRSAPIVICTGASDIARRAEAALAGFEVGVVLKPFDIDTLLAEIGRRLGSR